MFETLTETDIQIVLSFAKNNMRIKKTANQLFFNRNNITYHLKKVKNKTGLNPFEFYDLAELTIKLKDGDQS